ncbi:MAG TPA: M23 family metallopeptidase [Caldilineaceae bacterium]|nr:M23 family metallopeptidase [Caldilineaceae bacterium]
MTYKFVGQPLLTGRYEPEGIYLQSPLAGRFPVVQLWAEHAEFYGQFTYHGVPVKGHPGLDIAAPVGTKVQAVDGGRILELSFELGGFGRYIKIDHSWGESFYAHLAETLVDAGQTITRGEVIALSGDNDGKLTPHLHFAIRIRPFNRFDGWGGFTDPLPFLNGSDLLLPEEDHADELPVPQKTKDTHLPPLVSEKSGMRRP